MLIGRSIPIRVHTRWKSGEEEKVAESFYSTPISCLGTTVGLEQ
jgi:hypothetical protein